uniref:Basic tail protein n=1 Tax=Steinernema glaseri TaxID=37863 RepID=A0A1I7YQP9_9BILA
MVGGFFSVFVLLLSASLCVFATNMCAVFRFTTEISEGEFKVYRGDKKQTDQTSKIRWASCDHNCILHIRIEKKIPKGVTKLNTQFTGSCIRPAVAVKVMNEACNGNCETYNTRGFAGIVQSDSNHYNETSFYFCYHDYCNYEALKKFFHPQMLMEETEIPKVDHTATCGVH